MVEVYNESIYDLLKSPNEVQEKLQIQKKGKEMHVPVSTVQYNVGQCTLQSCMQSQ